MEFYQVLEKRRTVRDFSDRKVDDEVLKRILGAAFKAPTNDHLRQFEFVVVRGQERIGTDYLAGFREYAEYSADGTRSCREYDGPGRVCHVR